MKASTSEAAGNQESRVIGTAISWSLGSKWLRSLGRAEMQIIRWPKMCPSRKIREGTVRRVTAGVSATQVRIELVGSIDGLQPLRKEVRERCILAGRALGGLDGIDPFEVLKGTPCPMSSPASWKYSGRSLNRQLASSPTGAGSGDCDGEVGWGCPISSTGSPVVGQAGNCFITTGFGCSA